MAHECVSDASHMELGVGAKEHETQAGKGYTNKSLSLVFWLNQLGHMT